MSVYPEFERATRSLAPRTAIVLGSGLGGATDRFRESLSTTFDEIPGLLPTTVHGHRGRLAVGLWDDIPVLLFFGRLHFYEGHSRELVTGTVHAAANLGAKRLILTNAAGGIHPALTIGALMAIRGHIKVVGREAWRSIPKGEAIAEPYCPRLLRAMRGRESEEGRELPVGIYATMTGPSYETPAEIRALAACGADAVGMSTALEAEAAVELGMEVAAISCITNKAAGLSDELLAHADVLVNANRAVERFGKLIGRLVGY